MTLLFSQSYYCVAPVNCCRVETRDTALFPSAFPQTFIFTKWASDSRICTLEGIFRCLCLCSILFVRSSEWSKMVWKKKSYKNRWAPFLLFSYLQRSVGKNLGSNENYYVNRDLNNGYDICFQICMRWNSHIDNLNCKYKPFPGCIQLMENKHKHTAICSGYDLHWQLLTENIICPLGLLPFYCSDYSHII